MQLYKNPIYQTRTTENKCFPRCSQEWNNLSDDIESLPSPTSSKIVLLSLVKTSESSTFEFLENNSIKLLTVLIQNSRHLNEHKFTHKFLYTIYLMSSCGFEPETTAHFLCVVKII